MCGRYTLQTSERRLRETFHLPDLPFPEPRYNIAPAQSILAVRCADSQRQAVLLRWGLIPSWADDAKIGYRMINARAETAATKPAFRSAFRQRRCLVLADGFYEWQKENRKKQPFHIRLRDAAPFAFAGLWERWEAPDGEEVLSCTILTTEANDLVRPLHDRMPVILDPETHERWLDPAIQKPDELQPLLRPYPAEAMASVAVNPWVNDARHNDPKCLEPVVQRDLFS